MRAFFFWLGLNRPNLPCRSSCRIQSTAAIRKISSFWEDLNRSSERVSVANERRARAQSRGLKARQRRARPLRSIPRPTQQAAPLLYVKHGARHPAKAVCHVPCELNSCPVLIFPAPAEPGSLACSAGFMCSQKIVPPFEASSYMRFEQLILSLPASFPGGRNGRV